MDHVVTLQLNVKLEGQQFHSALVFSNQILGPNWIVCDEKTNQVQAKFRKPEGHPCVDCPFWIFIYAKAVQTMDDNQEIKDRGAGQAFITRAGCAAVSLATAYQKKSESVPICDINGQKIGKCTLVMISVSPPLDAWDPNPEAQDSIGPLISTTESKQQQIYMPLDGLKELTELLGETTNKLDELTKKFRWDVLSNVTPQLERFSFGQVMQHCGAIPMWAFTYLNLQFDLESATKSCPYLEQSLENACYMLGVGKPNGKTPKAELAEIINEMQTMALRAQLYVIDYSKRRTGEYHQVDKWENPFVTPSMPLMSFDCEDGSLRMQQESVWLDYADTRVFNVSPALRCIAKAHNQYISFTVGMTLRMKYGPSGGPGWVYHVAVLKLDRRFVLGKLGLPGGVVELGAEERWPAILLEGTAYTTGCQEYKTELRGDRNKICLASQMTFPKGETVCKVTPALMDKEQLYGVIQTMFSVELLDQFGIAQIELAQKGKRCASATSMVQYDKQVEWIPVKLHDKVMPVLDRVKFSCYPRFPVPVVTKHQVNPPRKQESTVDFCVRAMDWDNATLEEKFRRKLKMTQVQVSDDLHFVHVTD